MAELGNVDLMLMFDCRGRWSDGDGAKANEEVVTKKNGKSSTIALYVGIEEAGNNRIWLFYIIVLEQLAYYLSCPIVLSSVILSITFIFHQREARATRPDQIAAERRAT